MELTFDPVSWALRHAGRVLIEHRPDRPCCFVGSGTASVEMRRGNFKIEDYVLERAALRDARVVAEGGALRVELARHRGLAPDLTLLVRAGAGGASIEFLRSDPSVNRLWWRVAADPAERVWGCGEQMSYFDLRGRRYPLWTSEPGVGRDKSTRITWQADAEGGAGGDYYTTNYPQPTILSSAGYALHAETTAYADFDFRHGDFHELQFWAVPSRLELLEAPDFPGLVGRISEKFGRQPPLPAWILGGAVLGLKGGRDHAEKVLELSRAAGVPVAGLWCEDWAGVRQTSFGQRLFWDWRWNPERYPRSRDWVASLNGRGIRFLGYVNPYLCSDGTLYREARASGFLATSGTGGDYLVDFGEFSGGVVDFTNPAASDWFARRILRSEMLDAGLDGWMADFGEYLPTDVRLASGADPMLAHNAWPALWAEVNARAVAEAGRTGDAVFFMRAGYTGVQAHCPLLWAGDQSVDFSRHDGLQTVICAALSSGLMGNAYHHSDIGGYTSLYGNRRTPELFQRWAEMAAFTPVMRTHEGNRPSENFQFWQDGAVLAHFARMARIHVGLVPYARGLGAEAAARGLPLQRPLFLHFPKDPLAYAIQDQYLYGEDLLVAPVHEAGRTDWEPYLPAGAAWTHLWSGRTFEGGSRARVPAPIGEPPVFVRSGGRSDDLLLALAELRP
jgi:alpha-glucosidase